MHDPVPTWAWQLAMPMLDRQQIEAMTSICLMMASAVVTP